MSKRKPQQQPDDPSAPKAKAHAFTFGEPEPIDRASLLEYVQVWNNRRWYEPPVSVLGLANMLRAAPHHSSAIFIKRNLLVSSFVPTKYLSVADFEAFATDYLVFAHAYLEQMTAMSGRLLSLKRSPALFTRVGVNGGPHWFVPYTGEAFRSKTRCANSMRRM